MLLPINSRCESRSRREGGRAITSLLVLLLIVFGSLAVVAFIFGAIVPIGHVGVRKIAFGPGQGLVTKTLAPGFHWTIPGYSTIYDLPQTIQIIDFARDSEANPGSFGSLDIPTVDGTTIDIPSFKDSYPPIKIFFVI